MTPMEKMLNQKLYFCTDEEMASRQEAALEILYDFNQTRPSEKEKADGSHPGMRSAWPGAGKTLGLFRGYGPGGL